MRKFKRFPPRTLRFRSLLILAGAFALLAAFTPRANAALIRYYNLEGVEPTPPYDVNLESHLPAMELGRRRRRYSWTMEHLGHHLTRPEIDLRRGSLQIIAPGDPAANLNQPRCPSDQGKALWVVVIPFPSQSGIYNI